MEILNVGIPEILFVLVIMLIVLGPKEMAANSRKFARWFRQITQSETWKFVREASTELRELPNQLLHEAELDSLKQEIEQAIDPIAKPTESVTPADQVRVSEVVEVVAPPVADEVNG